MNEDRFVKGKQASDILNVHQRTLYQWDKKGWIEVKRTKGNIRLYNVDKYLREIKWDSEKEALAELKAYKEGKISWQNIRMFSHPMVIGNFEFNGYNDPIFVYDEEYIDSDHPNKIGFLIISQGEFELLQRFKKEYLDLS